LQYNRISYQISKYHIRDFNLNTKRNASREDHIRAEKRRQEKRISRISDNTQEKNRRESKKIIEKRI